MDSIVYNGDIEELQNIKNGYTKVILHSVASPRNDADFLISAREIVIDKEMNEFDDYNGSLFGANPVFLQEEKLEFAFLSILHADIWRRFSRRISRYLLFR